MVMGDMEMSVDLVVIGSGPGGYGAAFRAADLGLDVALVDPRSRPGGVCLHEGCIPSKTYLYLAELILDSRRASRMGVRFSEPEIDLEAMAGWKNDVIDRMASGLVSLCTQRGIQLIAATAQFENPHTVRLEGSDISRLTFKHAIIATGSTSVLFPGVTPVAESRIMSSGSALLFQDIPKKLLIIGGGYVGLELGTVYAALGSRVELAELEERLLPAVDQDLVQPLYRSLSDLFETIYLKTEVASLQEEEKGVEVTLNTPDGARTLRYDRVLIAMGRKPYTSGLGLENTGIIVDERGAIIVDMQQRTTENNIFAVGDAAGNLMLAHTATREGRVAAEVISGMESAYDVQAIPAVVYTDPQIAWCGLTEQDAAKSNIVVSVMKFPWKYSGRANTMGATDGLTKIIAEKESGRILGIGITGRNAEELISEGVLAIEMGALAEDMALSLHPHPSLSEAGCEAAELFLGSPTHILPKKM